MDELGKLGKLLITLMLSENAEIGPIELVVIQPTPYCNLDCGYCYLPNRDSKEQLSLDALRSIFLRLFKSQLLANHFTVIWHAGEPLVMPVNYYATAIQEIEKLRVDCLGSDYTINHAFQTNATLLSPEWCRLIKKYKIQIGVSLDGPAFLHDAHRKTRSGLGSYASTMRGINQLKGFEVPFHVITVLTQDSLAYPEEIFNFFVEQKITRIGFNIDEQEGVHATSSLLGEGSEMQYRDFMRRFYQLTKESSHPFEVREFEMLKQLICYGSDAAPPRNQQIRPFAILSIGTNGDFTTFSPELLSMDGEKYGHFQLGNLLHSSPASATASKRFRDIYEDILAGAALCEATCDYYNLCGGGAPGNKFFENRTFASAETMYCKYNVKIIADVMLAEIEAELAIEEAEPYIHSQQQPNQGRK